MDSLLEKFFTNQAEISSVAKTLIVPWVSHEDKSLKKYIDRIVDHEKEPQIAEESKEIKKIEESKQSVAI